MAQAGDPGKRYYAVGRGRPGGVPSYALVEAVPDAEKPDNPDKDSRDGPTMIEAEGNAFWTTVSAAGFTWVERGFKRFWVWNPAAAERARSGQGGRG